VSNNRRKNSARSRPTSKYSSGAEGAIPRHGMSFPDGDQSKGVSSPELVSRLCQAAEKADIETIRKMLDVHHVDINSIDEVRKANLRQHLY
jgi:hypothetical protein